MRANEVSLRSVFAVRVLCFHFDLECLLAVQGSGGRGGWASAQLHLKILEKAVPSGWGSVK